MVFPSEKLAALVLFSILLCSVAAADFTLHSLNVFINVNRDGSANVEEKLDMLVNGSQSRDLYEATRASYSDLATWKERTALTEMRHHITRATADISGLRVLPQALERCNSFQGVCHGIVILDYVVPASANGSGLIRVDHYKPRTVKYYLSADALSFEQTKTGDLVLPPQTVISMSIPAQAEKIYFSTLPANVADEPEASFRYDQSANMRYYVGNKRIFNWRGDTLSKFQFTYEIESPLESEVLEFFSDSQKSVIRLFLGSDGLAAFFLIAAGAASIYGFNRINK